jgi:glyoxylase-like metal-dependent hydrolase (beta-lactamase superfamily II)
MIITESGKISDELYVIGPAAIPVYLVDGPVPVLFDGGFTALAQLYETKVREILGNRKPEYLFLTHSHFDHIGAVSHFKQAWPDLKIGGSLRCGEILSKPNAIQLIKDLNLEGTKNLKKMGVSPLHEHPFESFDLDILVQPGKETALSPQLTLIGLHTPGHTRDFISYWIPEKKILIASEAVACYQNDGSVQTEFLVDFDACLDSLKIIKTLEPDILCTGHHAVFTGEDALMHISASVKAANDYLAMAEGFLNEEKGDIDRTVSSVKALEWDGRPWPKQPESAYLLNTRQRVKTIWARMNQH